MKGLNSRFNLNEENIIKYCNYFMKIHPEIDIKIERSPFKTHNSFYLRLYHKQYKKESASLRISDHDTKLTSQGSGIRNKVITKNTLGKSVLNSLQATYNALLYKIKIKNLETLFKQIDKNNHI